MLKVLVVEDEELIRKGIVLAVDWAALDCVVVGEASNGEEALDAVERLSPSLIITDLKMPRMDGIEMLRRLREAGKKVIGMGEKKTPSPFIVACDKFIYIEVIRAAAKDKAAKPEPAPEPAPEPEYEPWRLAGEVLNTYIVVEQGDKVLFIDKHAAHERLNFDRLKAEGYQPMVQALLEPVVFTPPAEEGAALLAQLPLLERFGFEAEDFGGGTLIVRAAPSDVAAGEIPDVLGELAGKLLRRSGCRPGRPAPHHGLQGGHQGRAEEQPRRAVQGGRGRHVRRGQILSPRQAGGDRADPAAAGEAVREGIAGEARFPNKKRHHSPDNWYILDASYRKKECIHMQKTNNLQDLFLLRARKTRAAVTVFLMNGYQLRGQITGYDAFVVVLMTGDKQQVIYKHAISTIVPERAISLEAEAAAD